MPVGAKFKVTEQLPLTATVEAQVELTNVNPAPVTADVEGATTDKGPTPVFVKVAVPVEEEPTVGDVKVGATNTALLACPIPVKATDAKPPPLWAKAKVPVADPAASGVNKTSTAQVPLTAKFEQLSDFPKTEAPAEIPTPEKFNVPVPVFVTVTRLETEEVPICCAEKSKLAGESVA
jgi:hypothetical protein